MKTSQGNNSSLLKHLSAALLLLLSLSANAATVTNFTMVSIPGQAAIKQFELREGQHLRVLQTYINQNQPYIAFTRENIRVDVGSLTPRTAPATEPFIYGPGTVELFYPAGCCDNAPSSAIISLEIGGTSPPGTIPIVNIPSNAVVIPADAGGPVQVLLESSTDLITWNSALPGTYGTSTTNRFFRVRTVRQ